MGTIRLEAYTEVEGLLNADAGGEGVVVELLRSPDVVDRNVCASIIKLRLRGPSISLWNRSWRDVKRPAQYAEGIAVETNRGLIGSGGGASSHVGVGSVASVEGPTSWSIAFLPKREDSEDRELFAVAVDDEFWRSWGLAVE